MPSLTDDLFSQLSGPALQQISQQLGTNPAQTSGAIAAALPMILGAMGRNTAQPGGAEALFGALGRDHNGGGGLGFFIGFRLENQRRHPEALQQGQQQGGQQPGETCGLRDTLDHVGRSQWHGNAEL